MGGDYDNAITQTVGYYQSAPSVVYNRPNNLMPEDWQKLCAQAQFAQAKDKTLNGSKPIVVCGGETKEAKDMDDAQAIAEALAHSKSTDAYILKPVKKIAPKRDVVTTDLT